jgi:hypothetical protein
LLGEPERQFGKRILIERASLFRCAESSSTASPLPNAFATRASSALSGCCPGAIAHCPPALPASARASTTAASQSVARRLTKRFF